MVYMATYNSGAAKISIPIMNEAGMAMISYANTYPGSDQDDRGRTEEGEPDIYYPTGKRNYMRVCPADDIQGARGANWAYDERARKAAYVLDDQSLYGKGVAQVFNGHDFEKLGGEDSRLRGLRPEGARLPVADDVDRGHGVRISCMSARRSRTTPRRSSRTCAA